jgi:hypothetical protein
VGATSAVDDGLVAELVARAQAGGVKLTGEGGLLQQLTKRVREPALEGELTDHLGHEPGERAEGSREDYRNGHRSKTVITESGPVEIAVPLTGRGRSSRSWSRSGSGVWAGWTRWSCRCRRRG